MASLAVVLLVGGIIGAYLFSRDGSGGGSGVGMGGSGGGDSTVNVNNPVTLPSSQPGSGMLGITLGNTNGNISNMGLAAQGADGWIYYADYTRASALTRTNGVESEVVVDDACTYLNVLGDWIYYCNDSDASNLYRIRTDGTGRERLVEGDCSYITATTDWIYFIQYIDEEGTGHLQRMDTATLGEPELLVDDCTRMALDGEYIYYQDKEHRRLYQIGVDGTGQTMLNSGDNCYSLNVADGWIYYQNFNDDDTLYRIRTDGTDREQLLDCDTEYLNLRGEWIYYCLDEEDESAGTEIRRVRLDGSDDQRVAVGSCLRLNVLDEWIYYVDDDNLDLYRVAPTGGDPERVVTVTGEVLVLTMAELGGSYVVEALEDLEIPGSAITVTADDLADFTAEEIEVLGQVLIFGSGVPQTLLDDLDDAGLLVTLEPNNWEECLYACGMEESQAKSLLYAFESLTADIHVKDERYTYTQSGEFAGNYSGYKEDGDRSGWGIMRYASGDVYAGFWADDDFEGEGTYTWADGDSYTGAFADGKRNGYGVYTWASGQRYEGEYKDGVRNGEGTMYYTDGTTKSGQWEDGDFVG